MPSWNQKFKNDGFTAQLGMEKLTSFDEARRAAASMELLRTEAFTFLKPAITDIGTAIYKESFYGTIYKKISNAKT